MRILFLTNFYPPESRGGYEEWCMEAAQGLRSRGHDIIVLTSRNGRSSRQQSDPTWIYRDLHLEMEFASIRNSVQFFTKRHNHERENLRIMQQLIESQQSDAILIWGMWNLPRSLPAKAEELMPNRTAYYMGDYWPTLPSQWQNYWQAPPRNGVTAIPKLLLQPVAKRMLSRETRPALHLECVIFPTEFLRKEFARQGINPTESTIIYGAIDTSQYQSENGRYSGKQTDSLTLLYIGRLSQEKGVQTAIMALSYLTHQKKYQNLQLLIAGAGEPEYETELRELVQQEQLEPNVKFLGLQPKDAIPELYQQADIFLFTSIWPEPFGRVIVEAMASGVAVIGAPVGGAAEIMIEKENALQFIPGDAENLASQIEELLKSPSLCHQISEAGKKTARAKFDLQRMVDEIEVYLQSLIVRK